MEAQAVSRFAMAGVFLVIMGVVTGVMSRVIPEARLWGPAHLDAVIQGTLLIAIAGVWRRRVKLGRMAEAWAFICLVLGTYGNWLLLILVGNWAQQGAARGVLGQEVTALHGGTMMALALGVGVLLSVGLTLVLKGLADGRSR